MKIDSSFFPSKPSYAGEWWSISFEPMVGSGEKITTIIVAIGFDGKNKVIQAIRDEVLDAIYGSKSSAIRDMIGWVSNSLHQYLETNKLIHDWVSPVGGFQVSMNAKALDDSLIGILRQAVRITASLGTLTLEAERSEEDNRPNEKQSEQWATRISDLVKISRPDLSDYFGTRSQLSAEHIYTKFGFMNDVYASNFGLLVPSRLSNSINSIKAKVYDLESLSRSDMVLKPAKLDIIVGIPSFDDPTLSSSTIMKMKSHVNEMTNLAKSEGIDFIAVDNANDAASRIILRAA